MNLVNVMLPAKNEVCVVKLLSGEEVTAIYEGKNKWIRSADDSIIPVNEVLAWEEFFPN